MVTLERTFLSGCCGNFNQCCSTISGVWYLCLAIAVMILLISCNDLLQSRCYFFGFPWSKSKLYFVHETSEDEEFQLLLVFNDEHQLPDGNPMSLKAPPPPPYSVIDPVISQSL